HQLRRFAGQRLRGECHQALLDAASAVAARPRPFTSAPASSISRRQTPFASGGRPLDWRRSAATAALLRSSANRSRMMHRATYSSASMTYLLIHRSFMGYLAMCYVVKQLFLLVSSDRALVHHLTPS